MIPAAVMMPDYGGACLDSLTPALLSGPEARPSWLPFPALDASAVVLFVIDGLGWRQLQDRRHLIPQMASMEGSAITSVAPTTTASALTSITLGMAPARHGIVGYKLRVQAESGPEVLNVLRWRTGLGDARQTFPPRDFQPVPAFGGRDVSIVSRFDFAGSGFTEVHQHGAHDVSWLAPSSIAVEVRRLLSKGEKFVYVYYDGLDRVAHGKGLNELYDAELVAVDRLVSEIAEALCPGAALVVTADHGQVEVGDRALQLVPEVLQCTEILSGEARFRWLHAKEGRQSDLIEAAQGHYGQGAWVATVDELSELEVFGGPLDAVTRSRLGDVALIALEPVGFLEPEAGDAHLICRHGGLSADEVLVPLISCRR